MNQPDGLQTRLQTSTDGRWASGVVIPPPQNENAVIAPTDVAADTVKAAKSGPDRLVGSQSRHFMASSYKKELLCAIAGDGMQVGIDLVMGSSATEFTYERRKAIDNRVGMMVLNKPLQINGLRLIVDVGDCIVNGYRGVFGTD